MELILKYCSSPPLELTNTAAQLYPFATDIDADVLCIDLDADDELPDDCSPWPRLFIFYSAESQYRLSGISFSGSVEFFNRSSPISKLVEATIARLSAKSTVEELTEAKSSLAHLTNELEESLLRSFDLAFTDQVTRLPNKEAFLQTLEMTIKNRGNDKINLMLVRIDNLNNIKNATGFEVGNQILRKASEQLTKSLDRDTFLARYNETMFALFTVGESINDEAESIVKALSSAMTVQTAMGEMEFTLVLSIGAAEFPDDSTGLETLVQCAEIALNQIDDHDITNFRRFSDNDRKQLNFQIRVETELLKPSITDYLSLVYQPIIDANTAQIRFLEVLMRWHSPSLGNVGPDVFIPIAERSSTIITITNWMIEKTQSLLKQLPQNIDLSINLSPVHLLMPSLVTDIVERFDHSSAPPSRYKIEITEGVFIKNAKEATDRLCQLKSHGFRIALDDFGVGFSNLNYLGQLPVDTIKINKSFLDTYPADRRSKALVESILTLSRSLSIDTIAEGVERQEQVDALRALGCTMFQGFLYSKPLNESGLMEYLKTKNVIRS